VLEVFDSPLLRQPVQHFNPVPFHLLQIVASIVRDGVLVPLLDVEQKHFELALKFVYDLVNVVAMLGFTKSGSRAATEAPHKEAIRVGAKLFEILQLEQLFFARNYQIGGLLPLIDRRQKIGGVFVRTVFDSHV